MYLLAFIPVTSNHRGTKPIVLILCTYGAALLVITIYMMHRYSSIWFMDSNMPLTHSAITDVGSLSIYVN